MSVNVQSRIERIADENIREAFIALSKQTPSVEDIINAVSGVEFGFHEVVNDNGDRRVVLRPIEPHPTHVVGG